MNLQFIHIQGGTKNMRTRVHNVIGALHKKGLLPKDVTLQIEIHDTTPNTVGQSVDVTGWTEYTTGKTALQRLAGTIEAAATRSFEQRVWVKPNGPGGRARFYYR